MSDKDKDNGRKKCSVSKIEEIIRKVKNMTVRSREMLLIQSLAAIGHRYYYKTQGLIISTILLPSLTVITDIVSDTTPGATKY